MSPVNDVGALQAERGLAQLSRALDRLTHACDETASIARDERAVLVATLAHLTVLVSNPRAVEGTIDGADAPIAASQRVGARQLGPGHRVEVRCTFGDNHWVSGFEVRDGFNDAGTLRYQLRRRSDGYVLPVLFDEADVRAAVHCTNTTDSTM